MRLIVLPEAASTMEEARSRLLAGEAFLGVLALRQTAGRGRLGRPWFTFKAPYGMACTYGVRTPCAHLPLVVAWAVYEALTAAGAKGLRIKWPNDILKNGQKVAGVLCETLGGQGGTQGAALVGVGVNLRCPPAGEPQGFTGGFVGLDIDVEKISEKIGACILHNLALYSQHGWVAFHEPYTHACSTFGQPITWRGPAGDTELTGLARGLNKSGHLEVVAEDGTVHIISGGDIIEQAQKKPA